MPPPPLSPYMSEPFLEDPVLLFLQLKFLMSWLLIAARLSITCSSSTSPILLFLLQQKNHLAPKNCAVRKIDGSNDGSASPMKKD
ncbi:Hypothetical protein NTJ_11440 [Nesidiocoris tenuis]|uniref:Uncharacterized protein n=1 Tax=Nesidiocoris tenuis TaxID=355587 RepID=A0ABN7B613_9HEMI|nr:Hypothetical protein NTJ_11440 [Nesidiocoris tenuis]